jgi:hypothetical protein
MSSRYEHSAVTALYTFCVYTLLCKVPPGCVADTLLPLALVLVLFATLIAISWSVRLVLALITIITYWPILLYTLQGSLVALGQLNSFRSSMYSSLTFPSVLSVP